MWGISRVEHVYSAARSGIALVTVRFRVNESNEESLVKVYERLSAMAAALPPGRAAPAAVELHSIDDVPFLTLTLWSEGSSSDELRPMAAELAQELSEIPETSKAYLDRRPAARRPRGARPRPHGRGRRELAGPLGGPPRRRRRGRTRARPCATTGRRGSRRGRSSGAPRTSRGWWSASAAGRPGLRARRRARDRRARRDDGRRLLRAWDGPAPRAERPAGQRVPRRDHRPRQAARAPTPRASPSRARQGRGAAAAPPSRARPRGGDPQLRPDGRGEVQRAGPAPADRHALRGRPHLPGHGLALGPGGRHRGPGDPGPHPLHLLPGRLHAEPRDPLRAHLLHRHPGRRRHRRGREHRAPPPREARRVLPARGRGGGGRGGQPHDPRHLHRHRRHPAHGLRPRADGSLHASHPDGGVGGDALLAGRGLHRVPLGRLPDLPAPRRRRGEARRRAGRRESTGGPWGRW